MSEQVTFDQETKKFHKKTKKQYCLRLVLANIAFFIAIGMLVYLVQTGPNLLHLKGFDDFYKTSKEKVPNTKARPENSVAARKGIIRQIWHH